MKITTSDFGLGSQLFTIENKKGMRIAFTNYGARIVDWVVEGKHIVLGFDCAQEYQEKDIFPGATVGRIAGRTKDGLVVINGQSVQLEQNDFPQAIHGGSNPSQAQIWQAQTFQKEEEAGVEYTLRLKDGEGGYPGNLDFTTIHTFNEAGEWKIEYRAVSDKDTVFNPTGHVYFNLNGEADQPIDNHELQIAASRYVPLLDQSQVVRGDLVEVTGTPFDFRAPQMLSEVFSSSDSQIRLVDGLDHGFLLDERNLAKEQARLTLGKLSVSTYTDQPSIVIFTANFGDMGTVYRGKPEAHHGGITFETQVAPGSPQIPELGDITLNAGETYQATTIYKVNLGE